MAIGSIGMSIDDFDRLTPGEFNAIYTAFERTCIQESWERVRFVATAILSPWSKKTLKAADVLPLPWDNRQKSDFCRTSVGHKAREEAKRRFDTLIKICQSPK